MTAGGFDDVGFIRPPLEGAHRECLGNDALDAFYQRLLVHLVSAFRVGA